VYVQDNSSVCEPPTESLKSGEVITHRDRCHYKHVSSGSRGKNFLGNVPFLASRSGKLCDAHKLILSGARCDMSAIFDSEAFEAIVFVCFYCGGIATVSRKTNNILTSDIGSDSGCLSDRSHEYSSRYSEKELLPSSRNALGNFKYSRNSLPVMEPEQARTQNGGGS
jgi:hypothetical protein